MPVTWVDLDEAVAMVLDGRLHNPTAVTGVLAAYAARSRGFDALRPLRGTCVQLIRVEERVAQVNERVAEGRRVHGWRHGGVPEVEVAQGLVDLLREPARRAPAPLGEDRGDRAGPIAGAHPTRGGSPGA